MLVSKHLRLASQQHLVIVLTTLSTIEIHMVPYKYTRKAILQFPTLAGESPKWNMGICDFPKIYALALGLCPGAHAYILGKSLMPTLQLLHNIQYRDE